MDVNLKNEMDLHISIVDMKTELFGDGVFIGDSRAMDTISNRKKQFSDYSDLDDSYVSDWYRESFGVRG